MMNLNLIPNINNKNFFPSPSDNCDFFNLNNATPYQKYLSFLKELSDPIFCQLKQHEIKVFLGKIIKKFRFGASWLKGICFFEGDDDGEEIDSVITSFVNGRDVGYRITYAVVDKILQLIESDPMRCADLWIRVNPLSENGVKQHTRKDGTDYRLTTYGLDGYHSVKNLPKKGSPSYHLMINNIVQYIRSPMPISYKDLNSYGFLCQTQHVRFVIDIDHDKKTLGKPLEYANLLRMCQTNGINPWFITETHPGGFHIVLNGDDSFRFFNYRLAMACRLTGEDPSDFCVDLRDIHLQPSDPSVKCLLSFLEDHHGIDRSYLVAKPDNQVARLPGSYNYKRRFWCQGDVINDDYQYTNDEIVAWLDEFYTEPFYSKPIKLNLKQDYIDSKFSFKSCLWSNEVNGYVNNTVVSILYRDYFRLISEAGLSDRDYVENHHIYHQTLQRKINQHIKEKRLTLLEGSIVHLYASASAEVEKEKGMTGDGREAAAAAAAAKPENEKVMTGDGREAAAAAAKPENENERFAKVLYINSPIIEASLKTSQYRPIVKQAKNLADWLAMRISWLLKETPTCGIGQVLLCQFLNERQLKCTVKTAENYLRYLVEDGYLERDHFIPHVRTYHYCFGEKLRHLSYILPWSDYHQNKDKKVSLNDGDDETKTVVAAVAAKPHNLSLVLDLDYEPTQSNEGILRDVRICYARRQDEAKILEFVLNKYQKYVAKYHPSEVRSVGNLKAVVRNWIYKKQQKAA